MSGDGTLPSLLVPIHPIYVLDSIAPNPSASPAEIALALRKIIEIAKWESQRSGHGELQFVASEPSIRAFALKHEHFQEITSTSSVLRLTLP